MNNSKIILIGVIILTAAAVVAFTLSQRSSSTTEESAVATNEVIDVDKQTSPNAAEVSTNSQGTKQSSAYLPHTSQVLSQTAGNRRVLFFYASWCPTCIPADSEFSANLDKIPSDVSVIRINYNDPETDAEEKALAQKYGVTYQHTYVQIDEAGNKVAAWNGGAVDELLANIK